MRNDETNRGGEAGVPYLLLRVACSRKLLGATLRYIHSVNRFFFIPQFKAKLFPGSIPLVHIDHPLDKSIPFKPETVGTYLSFIKLWVKALSFVRRELGREADGDIAAFLDALSFSYREAAYVYSRCLSTTDRPTHVKNPHFALIHIADPHLYCVPSLHVMVVCFAFLKVEKMLAGHGRGGRYPEETERLYENALRITETIIFIRQHSVNCISAGLYMVSSLIPEFGREEAGAFIERLFADFPEIARIGEIRRYILDLYDEFIKERDSRQGRDYKDVLVDFLFTYEKRMASGSRAGTQASGDNAHGG